MIRVKNERFSRFFGPYRPFFPSRRPVAAAGTVHCPALAETGKPLVSWSGARRRLPVCQRVGERSLLQVPWGICSDACRSSSRPKLQGTGKDGPFPCPVGGMSRCVSVKFKAKPSRYSKNKVLFTVPCKCAREALLGGIP